MLSKSALIVRGMVSNLQVGSTEEEFVVRGADKTIGGAAAAGLALGGLAGAATGAALSVGDTAEKVDFFTCKIGDYTVRGRFGKVNFSDGDAVEVVGDLVGDRLEAHAITRPSDRTIWMYPHCGRGSANYRRYCMQAITGLSLATPAVFIIPLMVYAYLQPDNPFPLWFWLVAFLMGMSMIAVILAFVASRFTKFAHLSDDIFVALGFDKPSEVDLHRRLREARKTFTHSDRFNYHPYARWVYKY